ncbi:hypothetical protein ACFQJ7_04940 [Halovenus rubra]|uniref:Uncharacterized protein n=2 Tax=Halovenus rubra TaxID=869890 RepID=A0ACC7DYN0_9EURY|nr:hypothetical protein [Halovenus rubra]
MRLNRSDGYYQPMNNTDPILRAARNGFGVLMVALLSLWAYQFTTDSGPNQLLFDLLLLGGLIYWASQLYYSRNTPTEGEVVADTDDSESTNGSDN